MIVMQDATGVCGYVIDNRYQCASSQFLPTP